MTMDTMFSDDLYGDLESSIFHTQKNPNIKTKAEVEARNAELESLLEKAQHQNKELTSKLKKCEKNYTILLLNARCLEQTAKAELERKNVIIARLARDLEGLSARIKPKWNLEENRPEITRNDIDEMCEAIRNAFIEAGDVKTDKIREFLSEQLQIRQPYKAKEKKSASIDGQKIKFENVHMYFYQQQCDFQRKEEVILFPQKCDPPPPAEADNLPVETDKIAESKETVIAYEDATTKMESSDTSSAISIVTDDPVPQIRDEIKSSTPDVTRTEERSHSSRGSGSGRSYPDESHRQSHSHNDYKHKRPRSSSKERSVRHVRLRSDGRGRGYDYDKRDHHYDRRRSDSRRDRDPPHYSSKSSH